MKANQAFKHNDEAVSPVIGVILMVAITVVLAAVVFVLVSNLSEGADAKPQVAFTKNENGAAFGGSLTVASITNGPIEWDTVVIGGEAGPCTVTSASTGTKPTTNAEMQAGDQINCPDFGSVTVSETSTDTLLYTGSFA